MPERVGLYAIPRTELVRRKTGFKKGVGSKQYQVYYYLIESILLSHYY